MNLDKSKLVSHGKITVEVFEMPGRPEMATGEVIVEGCHKCLANALADQICRDPEFAALMFDASVKAQIMLGIIES